MNIIGLEVQLLRRELDKPDALKKSSDLCNDLMKSFTDRNMALAKAQEIDHFRTIVPNEFRSLLKDDTRSEHKKAILTSVSELGAIFKVIEIRIQEIMIRSNIPGEWTPHSITQLEPLAKPLRTAWKPSLH